MEENERGSKALEMEAKAIQADGDIEASLMRLDQLAEIRRKDPVIEKEYEDLRDHLTKILKSEGPRYYIDAGGVKRYAYVVAPEPVEINVAALIAMNREGTLNDELLDKIAPRKADKEAYRRAASGGRKLTAEQAKRKLTRAQVAASSKIVEGTAHVAFSDPYEGP